VHRQIDASHLSQRLNLSIDRLISRRIVALQCRHGHAFLHQPAPSRPLPGVATRVCAPSVRNTQTLAKLLSIQDPQYFSRTVGFATDAMLQPAFVFDKRGRQLVTVGCFAGLRRWSFKADSFGLAEFTQIFAANQGIFDISKTAPSLDPAGDLKRARGMLRPDDLPQAAQWCAPADRPAGAGAP
jgi:hypothetical protein